MLYAIIIVLFILLIIFILLANKSKGRDDLLSSMSQKDVAKNVKHLALALRSGDSVGNIPNINKYLKIIKRAYKLVLQKVADNVALYECERWLYENYYSSTIDIKQGNYRAFAKLTHKKNNVRIIELARFMVAVNNCDLDEKNICQIVSMFNEYTPLHFDEIKNLHRALQYALVERISQVCQKIILLDKLRSSATADKEPVKRLCKYDEYLYFYKQSGKPLEEKYFYKTNDINLQNIDLSFANGLVDNSIVISNCINSIKAIKLIFDDRCTIELCSVFHIMAEDNTFKNMDICSQYAYIDAVERLSALYGASQRSIAKASMHLGELYNVHFGEILYDYRYAIKAYLHSVEPKILKKPTTKIDQRLYGSIIVLASIALTILAVLLAGNNIYRVLIAIIMPFACISLTQFATSLIIDNILPKRSIARMNFEKLPIEGKTLTVVNEYITSQEQAQKAVKKIKAIAQSNKDPMLSYALLVDLASSKNQISQDDKNIFDIFDELKEDKGINVFVRKRSFVKNKWIAYERKRGAINALNKALMTNDFCEFELVLRTQDKPNFIIVLDDDNMLLPGSIKQAVNTMLHPLNQKYDLMNFESKYRLSSLKNIWSQRYLDESGVESYCQYGNFYYKMSGHSIFCGKGIYRLDAFYNKLYDKLPNNRILSHDIIEGAILSTGSLGIATYEDAPDSFVSHSMRENRWKRGDLLLFPYIFSKKVNQPIYRYIMAENILNILLPLAKFVLLAALLLTMSMSFFVPVLLTIGAIYIIRFGLCLNALSFDKRPRYVFLHFVKELLMAIYDIIMLPYYVYEGIVIFAKTIFKSIFAKDKLLEWKTFYSTQRANSLSKHIAMILPSCFLSVVLALIFYTNIYFVVYLATYVIVANALYLTSKSVDYVKGRLNQEDRQLLKKIGLDTIDYFDENLSKNQLICDNYQFYPKRGANTFTSPTNIGFSLLSQIASYKLAHIDINTCICRLQKIIEEIKSLEKWKGHLYNWYSLESKQPMFPNFVSSVDSGNFVACLITTRQFAKEYNKDLYYQISCLIDEVDFDALFDKHQSRFYIGFNARENRYEGHYDLLASESRILCYVASCLCSDTRYWNSLSKTCIKIGGNTLVSWSGTTFEYLMPQLFLCDCNNSLITKSIQNALKIMTKQKCNSMWGISESAYYELNEENHYKYKAFGLGALSLRQADDRCVISPYSTFLALKYLPKQAICNIKKLIKNDMQCKYGLYEALDFSNNKNIVANVMSHHQGMILCGIVNAMYEDYFVKLFMSDSAMQGGRVLLEDRVPEYKTKQAQKSDFVYEKNPVNNYQISGECKGFPVVNAITNGKFSSVFDSFGNNYCFALGKYINKFLPDLYKNKGGFFYIQDQSELYSPTYSPIRKHNCTYNFSPYECVFENLDKKCKMSVFVPQNQNCEIRKIIIKNDTDKIKKYKCGYCEEIALGDFGSIYSHSAFSDMFVSTMIDGALDSLIAKRQSRHFTGDCFCSLSVVGVDKLEYESNLVNFIGRERGFQNPRIFDMDYAKEGQSVGDVLNACLGFVGEVEVLPHSTKEVICIKFYDIDIESLKSNIEHTKMLDYTKYAYESARQTQSSKIFKYQTDREISDMVSKLATHILYRPYNLSQLREISTHYQDVLPMGLDKTKKYLYYLYQGEQIDLKNLVYATIYLNMASINFNLVIAYSCKENDTENMLKSFVDITGIVDILNLEFMRFLRIDGIDDNTMQWLKVNAFICFDNKKKGKIDISYPILEEKNILPNNQELYGSIIPDISLKCGNGGFDSNGNYIINRTPKLPYSNVICGKYGGFVVTQNGGGFDYFENSNLNRTTIWENNPVYDSPCEEVYLSYKGIHRINKLVKGGYVRHSIGHTSFCGIINNIRYELTQSIIADGKAKVLQIEFDNIDKNSSAQLIFKLNAMLNDLPKTQMLYDEQILSDTIKIVNALNNRSIYIRTSQVCTLLTHKSQLVPMSNGLRFEDIKADFYSPSHTISIDIKKSKCKKFYIVISQDYEFLQTLDMQKIDKLVLYQVSQFKNLNKFALNTKDKNLDLFFNNWLAYQVVSSRINGKCAYYQAGGAIGFRDQLQDNLTMLYIDPQKTKEHILYCAKHQYIQGDVQHWWHKPCFGVRTHISDDRMFLPYLTFEYIKHTGDKSILDVQVKYLESDVLGANEKARLESPKESDIEESLLCHIKRSIDKTLVYGKDDLLLIGEGDWNDALNEIGLQQKGQSVWLSMFTLCVLKEYVLLVDDIQKYVYNAHIDRLENALNKAYRDGYFYRAVTDQGEILGSQDCEHFKYDILCQAWSVIADIGNVKMQKSALNKVAHLIDDRYKIIPLLSPAQTKKYYYGYISSYPQGVRENGGQYTHAAAWYVKALAMLDENLTINGNSYTPHMMLDMLNPISRCTDKNLNDAYKGEPYVLAGDIYTNKDNYGRMGWSWYTGSASILYDTILRDFVGIKFAKGNIVFKKPKLDNWENMTLTYKYNGSIYYIEYVKSKTDFLSINHNLKNSDMTLHLQENLGKCHITVGFR